MDPQIWNFSPEFWVIFLEKLPTQILYKMALLNKENHKLVGEILSRRMWASYIKYKPLDIKGFQWLNSINKCLKSPFPADFACKLGRIDLLEILWDKKKYPTQNGSKNAAASGHIKVIEWLVNKKIKISNQSIYVAKLRDQDTMISTLTRILD